jgi:hypothetical protein
MMTEKQVWPEAAFRVNVRLKKHKTQGQMLADFSEAVAALRAKAEHPQDKQWRGIVAAISLKKVCPTCQR